MKKFTMFFSVLFTFVWIATMPGSAYAAPAPNAFLGGGNALSRANSGESRGLANASPSSNLIDHLTFASTHGGRGKEAPPPKEDSDDEGSESEEDAENSSLGKVTSNENSNANGNASGGNGGNGGGAEAGGLVRAGSVVSNSNAVNVINTNIVRISTR